MLNDPAEFRETAQIARAEGYDCVKLCPVYVDANGERIRKRGVFTPAERKLARSRMEAVREGIGEECDIIIEWNSLTSTSGALQLADYFSDLNILFMEEPTHYNSPEAQIKVSGVIHSCCNRGAIIYPMGIPAVSTTRCHRHDST